MKILFIGNSFTNRNDLPGMIARLAASARPPIALESRRVIANGMALKTHWNRGTALREIEQTPWDFVVLQEQSTLPLKNPQRMNESVRLFDAEIKRRGAKTVLYLTWARQNTPERQDDLTRAYGSIGQELGAIVGPVGVAWQQVLAEHAGVTLHDRDKSHPNPAGSYLAACVFLAALLKTSPVGLPANEPGLDNLSPDLKTVLQEAAWRAVATFRFPGPEAAPPPATRTQPAESAEAKPGLPPSEQRGSNRKGRPRRSPR